MFEAAIQNKFTTLHCCKVTGVRTATAGAEPPFFTLCPTSCSFRVFRPITPADVVKLVLSLPNKQCLSDPLPTWLLKANVDILSPFLCQLFNRCLEHGIVPSSFKSGYVTPLLKKADLDAADGKSYRPITNLPSYPSCSNDLSHSS